MESGIYWFDAKRRTGSTEYAEQTSVIEWADLQVGAYPLLSLLFAVPNGEKREHVTRVSRTGRVSTYSPAGLRAKKMGARRGVPDLLLPGESFAYDELRGGVGQLWSGLAIEMKAGDGRPSPEQTAWLHALRAHHWFVCVCWGMEEAVAVLRWYCGQEDFPGAVVRIVPPLEGQGVR